MTVGARLKLATTLLFGLALGCKASVNAEASGSVNDEGAKGRAQAELESSKEGDGEMTRGVAKPSSGAGATAGSGTPGSGRVLLGARHDLKLRAGQSTASCECLAVAVGGAHGTGMLWSSTVPELDETTQLSLALSSEGQACKGEPKKSLGASYWGYKIRGNDVIVLVEAGHEGRPLTTGAVIPKPVGQGQVYVAPVKKKLPYGRPLEGKGLCKIGNPGPPRTAPFSELEIGEDAPERAPRGATGSSTLGPAPDDTPATIEMPSN